MEILSQVTGTHGRQFTFALGPLYCQPNMTGLDCWPMCVRECVCVCVCVCVLKM